MTQPPSVSASPGQTVKLSCSVSGGYSISSYGVRWYQQTPGNPPRYLLYYYSDSSTGRGSGVPDRFSGSASGSVGYLTISGLQAEDDADYYCLTWDNSAKMLTVVKSEREPRQKPFTFHWPTPSETLRKSFEASGAELCPERGFLGRVVPGLCFRDCFSLTLDPSPPRLISWHCMGSGGCLQIGSSGILCTVLASRAG